MNLWRPWRSPGPARAGALAAALLAAGATTAEAALSFATPPDVPNLPTLTLNGQSQTLTAAMNNFAVSLTVTDSTGFSITVGGDTGAGKSPVFKVYCPGPSACGGDPAGYVSGGAALAAGSLTFNTAGASWSETSGVGGNAPSFTCNSGCAIDVATPVKVATQAAGSNALATWTTQNFSASSLSLALPTTVRAPSQPGEVYHLDLVWTLAASP